MPKKGHTEEQIVAVLRQAEAGARVEEVCRRAGISGAMYYLLKRQYSVVGICDLRELAAVARRKGAAEAAGSGSERGPADPAGDRLKRAVMPRARQKLACWAQEAHGISERHAARLVILVISTLRYRSRKVVEEVLRRRLRELAGTHVRYGYRRLTVSLRREGWRVNVERIDLLYREEELIVRARSQSFKTEQSRDEIISVASGRTFDAAAPTVSRQPPDWN
jgi:putative transposase